MCKLWTTSSRCPVHDVSVCSLVCWHPFLTLVSRFLHVPISLVIGELLYIAFDTSLVAMDTCLYLSVLIPWCLSLSSPTLPSPLPFLSPLLLSPPSFSPIPPLSPSLPSLLPSPSPSLSLPFPPLSLPSPPLPSSPLPSPLPSPPLPSPPLLLPSVSLFREGVCLCSCLELPQ